MCVQFLCDLECLQQSYEFDERGRVMVAAEVLSVRGNYRRSGLIKVSKNINRTHLHYSKESEVKLRLLTFKVSAVLPPERLWIID